MKNLAALAFVPSNHVIEEFTRIKESSPDVLDGKKLYANYTFISYLQFLDLILYFEDNFIGRIMTRNRRKKPRFDISMWNCFERVNQNLPRTNNSLEGWHNAFHVRIT